MKNKCKGKNTAAENHHSTLRKIAEQRRSYTKLRRNPESKHINPVHPTPPSYLKPNPILPHHLHSGLQSVFFFTFPPPKTRIHFSTRATPPLISASLICMPKQYLVRCTKTKLHTTQRPPALCHFLPHSSKYSYYKDRRLSQTQLAKNIILFTRWSCFLVPLSYHQSITHYKHT